MMYITSIPYSAKLNHVEIGDDAIVYVDTIIPNNRFRALLVAMMEALIRKAFNKPIHKGYLP